MLAVIHQGIAIPILWVLLNKRGNSDTQERIALIKRFIRLFGRDSVLSLAADREFVGEKWFQWLNEAQIPFTIRIKKNFKVLNKNGKQVQVHTIFRDLKPHTSVQYARKICLKGTACYLTALRMADQELLILASNERSEALERYKKRWEIETLFSCLKGRGFDLEATHLTEMRKIKKLLVIHAIAFCWAHYIGEWQHEAKPLKNKTHGRKEKSIFRVGLDYLILALKQVFMKRDYSNINILINMLNVKLPLRE